MAGRSLLQLAPSMGKIFANHCRGLLADPEVLKTMRAFNASLLVQVRIARQFCTVLCAKF
jgi:hypothetical protein